MEAERIGLTEQLRPRRGPLLPNQDYTFCFHLIRKPSEKEAAEFTALASTRLAAAAQRLRLSLTNEAAVDSLQVALAKALPAADSIVVDDPSSIFLRLPEETDSARAAAAGNIALLAKIDSARAIRYNRLIDFAAVVRQAFRSRAGMVSQADAGVGKATGAVQALARDAALAKLGAVSDLAGLPAAERERLLQAGTVAGRAFRMNNVEAEAVARGIHPLDGPLEQRDTRDLDNSYNASEYARFIQNLDRSRSLLRDVRDLVFMVRARGALRQRAGLSEADIQAVDGRLAQAVSALEGQAESLRLAADAVNTADAAVKKLAASVRTLDFARVALRSTTSDTYKARANSYISLDAGLLRAIDVEQIAPYAGVNVYFRPVNKNAPLRLCEEDCWRRRLSLTVGITYTSLEEEGRVGDLFDGHSALVGVGARVTDYWRITMGALLLRSRGGDDDTELKLNATPALSTSIDIDVVGLLGKVGSALFP
jgi:hypothetical protein